jgi:putative membrane protein
VASVDPWTTWALEPLVLLGVVVSLVFYASGWSRLRRRSRPDLASIPRAACFAAGLAVIALALMSPLDYIGEEYLLSAHMTQHMLIGDVAPVLLTLGVVGPLALFVIPRPALRVLARSRWRAVLRVLGRPGVAFAAWAAVMWGWHVPGAFEYALAHPWAHEAEHLTMLTAGLGVWIHIFGLVSRHRMSHARRAAYALGLLAVGMVLSEVLFLREPLYSVYINQQERLLGLSPTADQTRAALIMAAEQMLTLVTAAALLMWSHVDHAVAERDAVAAPPGLPP